MSTLCRTCTRLIVTCDMGVCLECNGPVTSGSYAICEECSLEADQCQFCRKTVLNEPEDDLDTDFMHIITVDFPNRPSVAKGFTRQQVIAFNKDHTSKCAVALRGWLDTNNLESVIINRALSAIGCLYITCSINQAKLIEKAPNVSSIMRGN